MPSPDGVRAGGECVPWAGERHEPQGRGRASRESRHAVPSRVLLKVCEKDPVKAVKFFNPECRRERFLTPEEELELINHAPKEMRPCITFAANAGLRLREMLTLTGGRWTSGKAL